ncbi:allophanate hydrolase [Nodosilinea sp. LEGE 07088]|uniref:allophanate hydrolase n=1 Tax=Nodosilinea sp. LEGE 07088 TaxID=2777968 RepID=UPI001D14EA5C|nr:allophanate hydrolase [Nodosilinea sp. LEGE 07088]
MQAVEPCSLSIESLRLAYHSGQLTLMVVVDGIFRQISRRQGDGIWTFVLPEAEVLARAAWLEQRTATERDALPLWGIPFSVKDCIDIAGLPTSAGCPDFAYGAQHTNLVIQKLLDAGAILIGKTNLDQFATGLVGVRTGYDIPHNAYVADFIAGGSSSGSAVSVAAGLVSFSIGTDTGGSGRVPAGLNNIVGLKPTRGLLSTQHMVDACRTLDCVSIFALTPEDAWAVFQVAKGFDPGDPFARPEVTRSHRLETYEAGQPFRFGIPQKEHLEFFGNGDVERAFAEAVALLESLGGTGQEISYAPFLAANDLLFKGPWVAERYASVGKFIEANPESVLPTTREIILRAKQISAAEVFEGLYALAEIKRQVEPLWDDIDVLLVPTTGTAYRIAEVKAEPMALNTNLGYYTNFVNLLDLAAIALPNGFQSSGVPTGVTLVGQSFTEASLVKLGAMFHQHRVEMLGAAPLPVAL